MHLQHFMIIAIERRSEVRNETKKVSNKGNRQPQTVRTQKPPTARHRQHDVQRTNAALQGSKCRS